MKIEFSGAAGTVTGSAHLFTIGGHKVLLDCGLYQGADAKARGNEEFPFDPKQIDFLLLSHAHIDHSGRIPMLYKKGFRGRVIATPPTYDLCDIMLRDSAFIQEQDAERENRRRLRGKLALVKPIYNIKDAEAVLKQFEMLDYGIEKEIFPGLRIRFQDAGHMLGSSFIELWIKNEDGEEVKVVYSGDIGNHNIPLITEPHYITEADVVIMESTYGDRLHEPQKDENQKLLDLINSTVRNGGNVVIPSFAVGRTQEILYVLNEFAEEGKLDSKVQIYVDSPLASKATEVFAKNTRYFDQIAKDRMAKGDNVLEFPQLHFTESVDESKILNQTRSGLVIISASGMAEAGRIRHHIKHNLWRKECTIIFVGYQAPQTLGRIILDRKKFIKLFGEEIAVEARIEQLFGLSGHADKNGLIQFAEAFSTRRPKKIFLVHGDDDARAELASTLRDKGFMVQLPEEGTIVEIRTMEDLANPAATTIVSREHIEQAGSFKERLKSRIAEMDVDSMTDEEIINKVRGLLKVRDL
ncbi:MAG: MBL fold metallo-hydrolase [Clostridiaceae bacterium]